MSSSIIAIIIASITIILFMWNKLPMSVVAMRKFWGDRNLHTGDGAVIGLFRI